MSFLKPLCFFIFLLTCFQTYSQDNSNKEASIHWFSINNIDSLKALGEKKVLIDVYTSWCPPCKKMDEYTFKDRRIINYINANFYPIKFNGESKDTLHFKGELFLPTKKTHSLTHALGISAYPTLLFFDEKGNLITKEAKFFSPNEMEIALQYIQGNHYKTTSYARFKSNYEFE